MVGSYDSIPVVSGNGKYSIKPNSKVIKWGGLISMKTDAAQNFILLMVNIKLQKLV